MRTNPIQRSEAAGALYVLDDGGILVELTVPTALCRVIGVSVRIPNLGVVRSLLYLLVMVPSALFDLWESNILKILHSLGRKRLSVRMNVSQALGNSIGRRGQLKHLTILISNGLIDFAKPTCIFNVHSESPSAVTLTLEVVLLFEELFTWLAWHI